MMKFYFVEVTIMYDRPAKLIELGVKDTINPDMFTDKYTRLYPCVDKESAEKMVKSINDYLEGVEK